jgi:hypothetical protein
MKIQTGKIGGSSPLTSTTALPSDQQQRNESRKSKPPIQLNSLQKNTRLISHQNTHNHPISLMRLILRQLPTCKILSTKIPQWALFSLHFLLVLRMSLHKLLSHQLILNLSPLHLIPVQTSIHNNIPLMIPELKYQIMPLPRMLL